MTPSQLTLAVGLQPAVRLIALKGRIERAGGILPYETPDNQVALRVTVTRVVLDWSDASDYLNLSCGHAVLLDHEDDNASLVGAETDCERSHG